MGIVAPTGVSFSSEQHIDLFGGPIDAHFDRIGGIQHGFTQRGRLSPRSVEDMRQDQRYKDRVVTSRHALELYSYWVTIVKVFLLILMMLVPLVSTAHQPRDGDVHGTFGSYVYRTVPKGYGFESPTNGGLGLIANGDIDYNGGIELAFFYMHKVFSLKQDDHVITEVSKRISISSGYRHWFKPYLGVGLGFFSSYLMGSADILYNDFSGPAPKTSARDTTEYGFEFSVQAEPWRRGDWAAVVDARYALSVTPKPGEAADHYGVFIGVKHFIQGKEPPALSAP